MCQKALSYNRPLSGVTHYHCENCLKYCFLLLYITYISHFILLVDVVSISLSKMAQNRHFSNEDYVNMLLIHGECHRNVSRTCRLFAERYPNVDAPGRHTIRTLLKNCLEFGSFKPKVERIHPITNDVDIEATVLGYFHANPKASQGNAQRDLGVSESAVQRILKKHNWKPFKYHIVQELQIGDLEQRRSFCEFLLMKHQEDNNFLANIIWSDESKFTNRGMFNKHNTHYWSEQNPHLTREHYNQHFWSFNVYCAVKGNRILCVHIYDDNLNGDMYLDILRNVLSEALDNLPLAELQAAWYQQDGAPPHNTRDVCRFLDETFYDQWIAYNGPQRYPPRSPDITPLDFYIWGTIKNMVYSTAPTTKQDLQRRVREAFRSLDAAEIQKATHEEVIKRAEKCLGQNGSHFEHLIKYA